MNFDAHYMLTERNKENPVERSPSRDAYKKQLAECLNINRSRIFAFKNKSLALVDLIPHQISLPYQWDNKLANPLRYIPQVSLIFHQFI
ncbi:hypothetical protein JHK82_053026 [Glycine max]|nr:hypothetical protein JHK86_052872 [Glycine max]KAG4927244.1 hypothetical protein JHK85_053730 [Glycine max]KAG5082862.1 hypothetical protein JHK84_052900 [Glycine max]KAG5085629.1 hypothetical protein JHK82_053026 [Glycine max]